MAVEYSRIPPFDTTCRKYFTSIQETDLNELYGIKQGENYEPNLNEPKTTLLGYGTKAVQHVLMMDRTITVARGNLPLVQFLEDHQVTFPSCTKCGFEASLEPLKEAGFDPVPDSSRRSFFYEDDLNCFWVAEYAGLFNHREFKRIRELYESWKPEDFLDLNKLTKGLQYSKDFWKYVLFNFRKYTQGKSFPQDFMTRAEVLIVYYQALVDGVSL